MADENDHRTGVEQALSESQRLERDERAADLERQRAADESLVDALERAQRPD